MVLVNSTMLKLGTKAPDFNLVDVVSGKNYKLSDFDNKKSLLVMFICRHCPYVKHVEKELANIGEDYKNKNLAIVAISSNDPDYDSNDRPEKLKEQAEKSRFSFPYLFDETQEVAKKYTAACTPDFFLFNEKEELVYRGQLDGTRPGMGEPTGKDLRTAIDAALVGEKVAENQKPSSGCNIKWKSGNEPNYF